MLVLQVPPTSLIHKMVTKDPAGQTVSMHIYGGEKIIWTEI